MILFLSINAPLGKFNGSLRIVRMLHACDFPASKERIVTLHLDLIGYITVKGSGHGHHQRLLLFQYLGYAKPFELRML